jgi:hypothetical protein
MFCSSVHLELSCMHIYYHLVPLVLSFYRLTRKRLVILTDVVPGCITLSEAPRLARTCGTRGSDSPVRAL